MTNVRKPLRLALLDIQQSPAGAGVDEVLLQTNGGKITCRLHPAAEVGPAVVWVGGAGGGLDGPAGGLYPRLAGRLVSDGITSLRLDFRRPNYLNDCVLDTMMGVAYLVQTGCDRVALVGHSFGGAVVIAAGVQTKTVVGVAALSTQTYGTHAAEALSPRALLLLHGRADQMLPDICSREIYARAEEPKQIHLYPGCGHGLDECREEVDRDLTAWLREVLLDRPNPC